MGIGISALRKQDIERLADDAESGFDLSAATRERVRSGRPSLAEGEWSRISDRVAPALFAAAQQ
jgi:hypothetical protein